MAWLSSDKDAAKGLLARPAALLSSPDAEMKGGFLKIAALAREDAAFRSNAIDCFLDEMLNLAAQHPERFATVTQQLIYVAGTIQADKNKIINKAVSLLSIVNISSADTLPNLIVDLMAASRNNETAENTIITKSCDLFSQIIAKKPSVALAIASNLMDYSKGRVRLESYVLKKICDIFPLIAVTDGPVTENIAKNALFAASEDAKTQKDIIRQLSDILPALASTNPETAVSIFQEILTLSSGDPDLQDSIVSQGRDIVGIVATQVPDEAHRILQLMFVVSLGRDDKVGLLATIEKGCDALRSPAHTAETVSTFVKTLLGAAGANEEHLKLVIQKSCEVLPVAAAVENNHAVFLVETLLTAAGNNHENKGAIVSVCKALLPAMLQSDLEKATHLTRVLLSATANDPDAKQEVIEKVCGAFPLMVEKQSGGISGLFTLLMQSTDDETIKADIVKKAFFCVPKMPHQDDIASNFVKNIAAHVADNLMLRELFLQESIKALSVVAGKSRSPFLMGGGGIVAANDTGLRASYITAALGAAADIAFRDTLKEQKDRITLDLFNNIINMAGTDTDRRARIFEKELEILPIVAERNAGDALLLIEQLKKGTNDGATLAGLFVNKGGEVLASVAAKDVKAGYEMAMAMISCAGTDTERLIAATDKACGILRVIAEKDGESASKLFAEIVRVSGMDPVAPAIFKDVAQSKRMKDSEGAALILPDLLPSERQVIVWSNAGFLGNQFESTVRQRPTFQASNKLQSHFRTIFNMAAESKKYMAEAPMLKDVVRERLSGSDNLQPVSWDQLAF